MFAKGIKQLTPKALKSKKVRKFKGIAYSFTRNSGLRKIHWAH